VYKGRKFAQKNSRHCFIRSLNSVLLFTFCNKNTGRKKLESQMIFRNVLIYNIFYKYDLQKFFRETGLWIKLLTLRSESMLLNNNSESVSL
jgi:hypothetical protein